MNGTIFDIKEFSIHDGPGARVTVFLKGCPLRCKWCHNPEGLSEKVQLMHKKKLCTHCNRCAEPCDHPECEPFGRCIHACPNGCLSVSGKVVSADDLVKKMKSYKPFFDATNGGITVSGGEPMMQAEFVCEFADKIKELMPKIHLALQTSGHTQPETYKKVVGKFDFIMQDLKLAEPETHHFYTGVTNDMILQNVGYLKKSGKEFVFRIPLIPGITDTPDNLSRLSQIAEGNRVELLQYNALAGAKYDMLDMSYSLEDIEARQGDKNMLMSYFKNAKWG